MNNFKHLRKVLNNQLDIINNYSLAIPTASNVIQTREKINVDVFKSLFDSFNKVTHKLKLYKAYVCDSTLIHTHTAYRRLSNGLMEGFNRTPKDLSNLRE